MNSFLACSSSILLIGVQIVGCGFLCGFNPPGSVSLHSPPYSTSWPSFQTIEKQFLLIETSHPLKYLTANILGNSTFKRNRAPESPHFEGSGIPAPQEKSRAHPDLRTWHLPSHTHPSRSVDQGALLPKAADLCSQLEGGLAEQGD